MPQPEINPYEGERARDFAEERQLFGVFRCDRCASVWPLPWVEEDGGARRVCRGCADEMTEIEANEIIAIATEEASIDVIESLPITVIPALSGAVILQSVAPSSVVVRRSVGSVVVVL